MTDKILNKARAEAVYNAMCSLNNVGAKINALMNDGDVSVQEMHRSGKVVVTSLELLPTTRLFESYPSQAAFAAAYGLLEGEGAA